MARRPFASLLAVAGLGLVLATALLLVTFLRPLEEAVRHCTEPGGLCPGLVRLGHAVAGPLLLLLLPWSLCRGMRRGWWQWWATRRMLVRLRGDGTCAPTGDLEALCVGLGLVGKVTLVLADAPVAFCSGLFRPRIWISTGTLDLLSSQEMAAVLRHEHVHLSRRHPLQLLVGRSLAAALPILPVVSELAAALPRTQELVADRAVIRAGERHALGRALLALVDAQGEASPLSLAPGMVGALDARLDQLTGARTEPDWLSRRALLRTGLVFGVGVVLLWLSTLGLAPRQTLLVFPVLPPFSMTLPWHCLMVSTILWGVASEAPRVLAHVRR